MEVDRLDDLPLELVGKALPAGTYVQAIPRGQEIGTWENTLYEEWLPQSGYELMVLQGYSFQAQVYEEGRFKGPDDLLAESEIDVHVSVRENRERDDEG